MLRKFRIKMNDKEYLVEMEEIGGVPQAAAPVPVAAAPPAPVAAPVAVPQETPAPAAVPSGEGITVDAPMPGRILKVLAQPGETVKEDQPIVILEAMKMENEIVAPKSGVLSAVYAAEGKAIDVGEPIFTIG